MGSRSAGWPECPSLGRFITSHGLSDARILREHAEDDETAITIDHFTYWTKENASRIDRFYVPTDWALDVLWLSTTPPPDYSDHQQVELHLRVEQLDPEHTRRHHAAFHTD